MFKSCRSDQKNPVNTRVCGLAYFLFMLSYPLDCPLSISFPTKACTIVAGNISSQGERVDNAFAYIVDNSSFYIGTKRSDANTITGFPVSYIAIGN